MRADMQEIIRARAIEWHIRLRHGDDALWDAFTDWLAENRLHVEAYEEVETADLSVDPLLPDLMFQVATNDRNDIRSRTAGALRRRVMAGGALAASIAAALLLLPHGLSSRYEVATGAGESRVVQLDAGTRVILNGSTRMTFDHDDPRFAALASGEALFHVRHDIAHPFRLEVGNTAVEDAGTTFNVVREGDAVRVAVAEGKILYNPGKDAIPLDAGQGILAPAGSGTARIVDTPPETVGSWQRGQLIYRGEPLSQVAQDLSRALKTRITVAPSIADRPFRGTIAIDGSGPEQLNRLKHALGVDLEAGAGSWNLKPSYSGEQ